MAIIGSGNPVSMSSMNVELGDGATDSISLRTTSNTFGLSSPDSFSELYSLSNDSPEFTTALTATADSVDPSKVVLAWAVGVPTGAPAISAFTLKRATDSNISANVSTLSTNAAGSPVNDTGLAGGTQFFYRASATNAIGTTVSNDNATTTAARTSIAIKYLKQVESGESDIFTGWISTAGSVASTKGELVLCAESAIVPEDSRGSGRTTQLQSETDFIADGTLSNGDTLFAGSTGTGVTDIRPNEGDFANQETFLVDTTQDNIFQINTSGVLSNVRSRTPNVPTKPTLVANSGTQITVTIPTTNTAVTREFDIHRSIGGGSFARVGTIVPSDSGSIDDTSISTTFVNDSGISAGNAVVYKVFAQNAFATSSASTTSDSVTTPSGVSFSVSPSLDPATSIAIFSDEFTPDSDTSSAVTISVTNRQGNIDVTRTQNTSGAFAIAAGASDPGTGATFGANVDNIDSDTIVVRAKFSESGRNTSEGPINNVITLTDDSSGDSISINISCRVTNL